MLDALRWVVRRTICLLIGHRMASTRIYHAQAKSVMPGYHCLRCGHTQSLLRRWQERHTVTEHDDDSD